MSATIRTSAEELFVVDGQRIASKTMVGERTCLEVSPSDMILNVKKMVIKEFNLDNEACPILHFDGEILEDSQSLISYDIINGDTLTFIGRKKTKKMKIFIVDSANKRMALDVESSDNIFKVKEKIAKKNNSSNNMMVLIFNGRILEDNFTIEQLKIKEGMEINYLGQFLMM